MFSPEVYIERRRKLRKLIPSGVILFLGHQESSMNYVSNTYRFRQNSNFLYYFGFNQPNLAGIIDIEEGTDSFYGDDLEIDDIIWTGTQQSMIDKGSQIGIGAVLPLRELRNKVLSALRKGRKVHFTPPYRGESKIELAQLLGLQILDLNNYSSPQLIKAIVSMRSIKEDIEIAEIEKACTIGYEMHLAAMLNCKVGTKEHTLAGLLEGIALGHNGQVSFPIILSQNSQILHNHQHDSVLEKGRLLLIDAGAETDRQYASDFTRTIPVGGRFTDKQKAIYNIVLSANNQAIQLAKPNISYLSIHQAAALTITEGLADLGIMKGNPNDAVEAGAHALFFPHGLGHMMGLDVHDMEDLGETNVGYNDEIERSSQFGTAYLRMGRRLEKNFVLTVEPGIYFIPALIAKWKSEKINNSFINFDRLDEYLNFGGIRLEDDILITDNSARLLSKKRIPINPDEIEQIMK